MDKQYNKNDPYLKKLPYDAIYILEFGNYKLRNCPFCNQKPWTGGIRDYIGIKWTIECRNCRYSFVYSRSHLGGFESKQHLVDHWNGYKQRHRKGERRKK